MTVLIVGGGGREHALAIGLAESESVGAVHTCPGNAGTSLVGTCLLYTSPSPRD